MVIEVKDLVLHPLQLVETEVLEINSVKKASLPDKEELNVATRIKGEAKDFYFGYSYIEVELLPKSESFSLKVTVRGKFKSREEIEKLQFEKFLAVQGIKILWPYMREVIYDISGKILRKPYLLPTLDVLQTLTKAMKKKEDEINDEKDSTVGIR